MTILPSSILVDEIYVAPLKEDIRIWFRSKFSSKNFDGNEGGKTIEIYNPEEPQDKAPNGHVLEESSTDMNRVDRYLVETYAPLVSRRSSYLIVGSIVLVSLVTNVLNSFRVRNFISLIFHLMVMTKFLCRP
jgi:hypothetical protein